MPTDLRSEAQAYKRDKDHDTKWRKGGRHAPGQACSSPHWVDTFSCSDPSSCGIRPKHRDASRECGRHFSNRTTLPKTTARKVFRQEPIDTANDTSPPSDSSSDEEIREPSAAPAPVPQHEVMYSYDAYFGPSAGRNVLGDAVTQAVKRFENKQTEKLIKNEYDLVLDGKEDPYAGDVEDDFELIEHEHLA